MLGAASLHWRANRDTRILVSDVVQAALWSPFLVIRTLLGGRVIKALPRPVMKWIQRTRGLQYRIPIGSVRFGDLKRLSPISDNFGSDRGSPLDRHYTESFLAKNATHIRGRVLEAHNNIYPRRFGGAHVERSDVISVEENANATIVGD